MPIRTATHQSAAHMDLSAVRVVDLQLMCDALLLDSVKSSTNIQYQSRLNTLRRFLIALRSLSVSVTDADVASCTQEEFIAFLYHRRQLNMGSVEGLQLHRRLGQLFLR